MNLGIRTMKFFKALDKIVQIAVSGQGSVLPVRSPFRQKAAAKKSAEQIRSHGSRQHMGKRLSPWCRQAPLGG